MDSAYAGVAATARSRRLPATGATVIVMALEPPRRLYDPIKIFFLRIVPTPRKEIVYRCIYRTTRKLPDRALRHPQYRR